MKVWMTEQELLDYHDCLVSFASSLQQYGARRVMSDFQQHYPDLFQEVKIQINRFPPKPVAALLRK